MNTGPRRAAHPTRGDLYKPIRLSAAQIRQGGAERRLLPEILIVSQRRLEFMFSNSRQGLSCWPRQATLRLAGGAASRCDPDHDAIGLPVLPAAHTVVAFCCLAGVMRLGLRPASGRRSGDVQAFEGLAGNGRDDLEVLIHVQDSQAGQFSRRGDDEIGNG